jgi:hypothetical protein
MIQRANQWPLIFLPTSTIYVFSTIDNHLPQKENGKKSDNHFTRLGDLVQGFSKTKANKSQMYLYY